MFHSPVAEKLSLMNKKSYFSLKPFIFWKISISYKIIPKNLKYVNIKNEPSYMVQGNKKASPKTSLSSW